MSIRKIDGVVIDADTIDGKDAQNAANQVPVLDASADIPDAQIPDTITRNTELTTHAGLDTGVHGSGGDVLATDADITTHNNNTTTAHGAVSAATASKIIVRDAAARAKVAAPSAEDDIALKSNVTTVNTALTNHGNLTTAHGAVVAATASKMVVRDAQGQAKFAAPAEAGDALIKGTRVAVDELPAMTDEKIWKGTGGNVEEVDWPDLVTHAGVDIAHHTPFLLARHFSGISATGTFVANVIHLNDGDGMESPGAAPGAVANAIAQYAEVDLGGSYRIGMWRQYGDIQNGGDGVWKIEYYDGSWHDWVTGKPTRATADWSAWELVFPRLTCSKIRLTCTTVDTNTPGSWIAELQVAY